MFNELKKETKWKKFEITVKVIYDCVPETDEVFGEMTDEEKEFWHRGWVKELVRDGGFEIEKVEITDQECVLEGCKEPALEENEGRCSKHNLPLDRIK